MPALSDVRLRQLLLSALPGATSVLDHGHTKPIILNVPNFGPVRIYLWTTTPDASAHGRPAGEHKAQIIISGTARGSRQKINIADMPTALLGYSPVFGVFTAWQAELHCDSAYSKNLQFKEDVLDSATTSGWACDLVRQTNEGPEVRLAVHPLHLPLYLTVMQAANAQHLVGDERRAFYIANGPKTNLVLVEEDLAKLPPVERKRITAVRKQRDIRFKSLVRSAYGETCAVCNTQLNIIEAAHVIPVHDSRSRDEVWNGIALCCNHHRLFDKRILRINFEGVMFCVEEEIDFLRQTNRIGGIQEVIAPFVGHPIKYPDYWHKNAAQRNLFGQALLAQSLF